MDLGDPGEAAWPTPAPQWSGPPVMCMICLSVGTPFRDKDDHCWRLPVHGWDGFLLERACPGSLTAVTAEPVPRSMEERIEANMVAAMPPDPNTDIPAGRAVEVFDA